MKIAVYTCLTGGYDRLEEVDNTHDEVDCICFTDNPSFTSSTWDVRYIKDLGESTRDKIKTARMHKICAHRYLSEYSVSVWIDANMFNVQMDTIVQDCYSLAEDTVDMYITDHCGRNDVYEELQACIKLKKDDPEIMRAQIEKYRKEGLPEQSGLVETTLIFREHNSERLQQFCEQWWEEVRSHSIRDQLSFNYVAWKLGYDNYRTFTIQQRTGRYSNFRMHLKNYANSHQRHVLMAGPFLGELGWELMAWQAIVRFHTKAYGFDNVQVLCRPGHEFLYRDCADEFVTIDKRGQHSGPMLDGCLYTFTPKPVEERASQDKIYALAPSWELCSETALSQKKSNYIAYGNTASQEGYRYLFCIPRNESATNGWCMTQWSMLCEKLKSDSIACIGDSSNAAVIEGTNDLRDIPLARLVDVLAGSALCIGPVSDYMHLAALCRCSRVIIDRMSQQFLNNCTFHDLLTKVWNPFGAATNIMDTNDPQLDISALADAIQRAYENK